MNKNRFTHFAAHAVWDRRLTAGDLRVLAALGTYTNEHGFCFPSQKTLADRIGVTPPTVSAAITKLVQFGYVEKQVRTEEGRGRRGCIYRVRFDQTRQELLDAGADLSVSRNRVEPKSGPAEIGSDRVPTSAPANVGYIEEQSQEKNPNTPKAPKLDSVFADVWACWPGPGRGRTTKEKVRAVLRANQAAWPALMRAVNAYLASDDAKKDGGKYVPGLHTWLREKLETWIELSAEARAGAIVAASPGWFTDLKARFVDSGRELEWKERWRFFIPVSPPNPGNAVVTLRAPGQNTYDLVTDPHSKDIADFKYATGYAVEVLPPEPALSR